MTSAKTCVKIGNHCRKILKANVGVQQGENLSLILHVVCQCKVTKTLQEKLLFSKIYKVTYTDDQYLYSRDDGAMNDIQNKLENSYAKLRHS